MAIKVRARARGYYGEEIKEVGAEFLVPSKEQLGRWMDVVGEEDDAPKKAKAAAPKRGAKSDPPSGDDAPPADGTKPPDSGDVI